MIWYSPKDVAACGTQWKSVIVEMEEKLRSESEKWKGDDGILNSRGDLCCSEHF